MSKSDRYLVDSFSMPGDMVCETFSTGMTHVLVKAENCSLVGSKVNCGRDEHADIDYAHLFNISAPVTEMRDMALNFFTAATKRLLAQGGPRLITPEQAPHMSKSRLALNITSREKNEKIMAVMDGYDGPDENRWVILASMMTDTWVFNESVSVDSIIARATLIDYDAPDFTVFSTFSLFNPNYPNVEAGSVEPWGYSGNEPGLLIGLYRAFANNATLEPYADFTMADMPHHANISNLSINAIHDVTTRLKNRTWDRQSMKIDLTGAHCQQIEFLQFAIGSGGVSSRFVPALVELTRNTEGDLMERIDPKFRSKNVWIDPVGRIGAMVNALTTDPDQKAIYYRSIESKDHRRQAMAFAQVAMIGALVNNPVGMKEAAIYLLSPERDALYGSAAHADAAIAYLLSGSDLPIEWWINLSQGM